jgi:hypothetical protein
MVASADKKTQLAVKASTWEISPLYTRNHPVIEAMYRNNPRKAERDFGANPPALASTVFVKETVQKLFCLEREGGLLYTPAPDATTAMFVRTKMRAKYPPSIMSLDAGATNNAFAVTITAKDGHEIHMPIGVEIVAAPRKPIDFVKAYTGVIKPLIETYNVKSVFADRWNSKYVLDQIHTDFNGVVATQAYSLRSDDMASFIEFVNSGQLKMPVTELPFDQIEVVVDFKKELLLYPASHLYLQFLTVQEQRGMLYKGGQFTDDILRSLMLGVTRHFDKKVTDYLSKFKVMDRESMDANAMFLVGGRSSFAGTPAAIGGLGAVVSAPRRF